MKIILATNNRHKILEMRSILKGLKLEILTAKDFPDFPEVAETGETLAENAALKAESVWNRYHLPAVADDTGLEVEFLGGAPGVYSSRFAGVGCTYEDNNRKLLELLKGVPEAGRSARFRTVIAVIDYKGRLHLAEGAVDGFIAKSPTGSHGFGYDPVFMVADLGKTMAELSPIEKNKISHRGRALEQARNILANIGRI